MSGIVTLSLLQTFLRNLSSKFVGQKEIAKVARTGSYNDLIDRPEAPDFQCSLKCYLRSQRWLGGKKLLTIPPWMVIAIDGAPCMWNKAGTIDISDTDNWDENTWALPGNRKGKDFYIYALRKGNEAAPCFLLSSDKEKPAGYTAAESRRIGGFHCLCEDVGEMEGHALSGFSAGDILPASVWDLRHRPACSPEGMVFDGRIWVDIYLDSWNGEKLVSAYKGKIADGMSEKSFNGLEFQTYLYKVGKRLPSAAEFMHLAEGTDEGVAIAGEADPETSGGHTNTAGRRIVSRIGCEDTAGVMWQCTSDIFGAYFSYSDDWETHTAVGSNGGMLGASQGGGIKRLAAGGSWKNGSHAGPKSFSLNFWVGGPGDETLGARGVCDPLVDF